MATVDIHSILSILGKQWARYKDCRGFPSMEPFMRESPKLITHYGVIMLSEENCLAIERLVMILHQHNLLQYQILMAKYYLLLDEKEIWRTLEISRAGYHQHLAQAKCFMEGAILGAEIKIYP